MYMIETDSQTT